MTLPYVLTPEADVDLQDIWDYTVEAWGVDQAVIYLETIERAFVSIAEGSLPTRPSPTRELGLEYVRCEHHYIFVLREVPLQVIRVLHERMDYMTRLKHRLA